MICSPQYQREHRRDRPPGELRGPSEPAGGTARSQGGPVMTLRPCIDAASGTVPDGWAGTSRHWPVADADIAVECLPRDVRAARLLALRDGEPIAEAELRSDPDGVRLALTGSVGRHPADAPVVTALVEAAFQRCPEARRLRVSGLGGAPALLALAATRRKPRPPPTRSWSVALFYQLPLLWLTAGARAAYPGSARRSGRKTGCRPCDRHSRTARSTALAAAARHDPVVSRHRSAA